MDRTTTRAVMGVSTIVAREPVRSHSEAPSAQAVHAVMGREGVIQIEIRCSGLDWSE